jgi:hypothetical protein
MIGKSVSIMHRMRYHARIFIKEADKLLRKLDGYAVDHGVPMEWREY